MHSPDLTQENIARLLELFPNCVTEAKADDGTIKRAIDFDQLRQELTDHVVDGPQERYQLNWPGKREALLVANAPIAKTLRPCREESIDFDAAKNLFIEGDNLDALKLLQETYLNRIKLIYIDPPYNTGKDFVYEDNFSVSTDKYFRQSNQADDVGSRLVANTEANGRFHSDWLSMMYSRIKLARNLLAEDGAMFLSIDDHEQENLKKLCIEIFGEENFVAHIVWQKKFAPQNDARYFSDNHDHILLFARSKKYWSRNLLPRSDKTNDRYSNPDNDERGPWASSDLLRMEHRDNGVYVIKSPTGKEWKPEQGTSWRHPESEIQLLLKNNEIWFGSDGNSKPRRKRFLKDVRQGVVPETIWSHQDCGHNQEGTQIFKSLFDGEGVEFTNPKPPRLIKRMLDIATNPLSNDIVLDFFAGSGSTAHAVIEQNKEDGGNRRFILIQLPESLGLEKYSSIADITKERVRRVLANVRSDEQQQLGFFKGKNVLGFRVFKIDTSNLREVFYKPDSLRKDDLFSHVDNIKEDRTPEDLLFQVLLDWGVDLSLPISQESIEGKTVFFVDQNALAACFDTGITEEMVKKLATRKPLRVVFRDSGFSSDAVKINVEQIFKLLSPDTEVKVI